MALLDSRSAADLGWRQALSLVAEYALGEAGRERLLAREPASNLEQAIARNHCLAEVFSFVESGATWVRAGLPNLVNLFGLLEKGGVLKPEDFRSIAEMLKLARELRRLGLEHEAETPRVAAMLTSSSKLEALLSELNGAIDDEGNIIDGASRELSVARGEVRSKQREFRREQARLLSKYEKLLQGEYWTERGGRHVLPILSSAKNQISGSMLDESASAKTAFIEPQEIGRLSAELSLRQARVAREEQRVLSRLSKRAQNSHDDLLTAYEACVAADVYGALLSYAKEHSARALVPEAKAGIEFCEFRHPLIAADEVVSNSVALRPGSALIISGPNAGGKTVVLKAVGLIALMVLAGLPVPVAAGSRMGWFSSVMSDIGDGQSLDRSLSTFSAHLERLAEILNRAGPEALVLLDEIAAATDPVEGSALAAAFVSELCRQNSTVLATSHYDSLKRLAKTEESWQSAAVGFDSESLRPTFKLHTGVAAPSQALHIALRFGIPGAVVDEARSLVPEQKAKQQALLEKLEAEQEQLIEQSRQLEQERGQMTAALAAEERAHVARLARERKVFAREVEALSEEVRLARQELSSLRKRLRKGKLDAGFKASEKILSGIGAQVAIGGRLRRLEEPASRKPSALPLRIGTMVFVPKLNQKMKVIQEPSRGRVQVAHGQLRFSLKMDEVSVLHGEKPAPSKKPNLKASSSPVPAGPPLRTQDITLDLRGFRAEDAGEALERFVDGLLRRNERVGFVLHGHGGGVLKSLVRELLPNIPYVKRARPAESGQGGDAFTVFWLDDDRG